MPARLRQFFELPAPDRRLLWSAMIALVKARFIVMFVPVRKIMRPASLRIERPSADSDPARIGWAIEAASRSLPMVKNCLVKAIAGRNLLARHGLCGQIRLGVLKNSLDTLSGHAWLECADRVITGAGDHCSYAVMPLDDHGGADKPTNVLA